jgi:hypothetical protein
VAFLQRQINENKKEIIRKFFRNGFDTCFETTASKFLIKFEGLEISSKVFYGKKDTYYLEENEYIRFIG